MNFLRRGRSPDSNKTGFFLSRHEGSGSQNSLPKRSSFASLRNSERNDAILYESFSKLQPAGRIPDIRDTLIDNQRMHIEVIEKKLDRTEAQNALLQLKQQTLILENDRLREQLARASHPMLELHDE
jgi:hypothetical protein